MEGGPGGQAPRRGASLKGRYTNPPCGSLEAQLTSQFNIGFAQRREEGPCEDGRVETSMKSRTLLETVEWLFGLAVAFGCFMAVEDAARVIHLPYQLNYVEGVILSGGLRIVQGQPLYPPPGEFPIVLNQYGPVFYWLVATLLKLFGIGFTASRVLVVLSALLIALLLALLLHHWTRSWVLALSFGFLYCSLPLLRGWLFLVRVDLTGIALTLAGLYVFVRFPRRWYLSVPFLVAAIFCKYSLVAAPGACLLYLLAKREWRKTLMFGGATGLLSLLAFLGLQHGASGHFAFHTIFSHADPYTFSHFLMTLNPVIQAHSILMVLAAGLAVYDLSRREISLPVIYFALASLTAVTSGKYGAVENHFLEWLAAACLCAGLCYHALRTNPYGTGALTVVLAALAVSVLALPPQEEPNPRLLDCDQAYAFVENAPGQRILSENVGAVVMAGKPVLLSDPFVWTWLVKRQGWPQATIDNRVRSRSFDLIILYASAGSLRRSEVYNRWPLSFLTAVEQNYKPAKYFTCQDAGVIYEPAVTPSH